MTTVLPDQDIDLDLDEPQPVREIHTRWPGPASMLANSLWAAMALLAGLTLVGGFTGRLDIESPAVPVLIVLMYALAWAAVIARKRAERLQFNPDQEV
ncbi:hypothetical protein ACQP2C_32385 [Micromonospora zamorensis]|uniref:hypothetical protein n=1 Tax=Micromonospora zamorensis TaxID=709883 RepID=UPI003D9675D9